MPGEKRMTLRYRILRYTPNIARDEWVNIGVLLERAEGPEAPEANERALRIIEEQHLPRVRRLHPEADLDLLRALPAELGARLAEPPEKAAAELARWNDTMSNVLQLSPAKGLLAGDFEAELARLYDEQVGPPPRARGGLAESARSWLRGKLRDVFRRHGIFGKMKPNVPVEEFTHPGDTFKFDFAYQNGARGFVQSVLLARDALPSKALTYTAEHIRRRYADAEFAAITDAEPARDNPKHQFLLQLFEEQNIRVVPMTRVERFAEELRVRLQ